MKFLLDENVPNQYKEELEKLKYKDIRRINDFGKGLSDKEVFEFAQKEERIILTFDTDFHAYKNEDHYGIVSISRRVQNPIKRLLGVIKQISRDTTIENDELKNIFLRLTEEEFEIGIKKKWKYKTFHRSYK